MQKTKPNFFIVGVTKCGTTSVLANLSKHPDVWMVQHTNNIVTPDRHPYEMHFFSQEKHLEKGMAWYLDFFKKGAGHKIIGEKSPGYFRNIVVNGKTPIEWIRYNFPDAKILIIFRNPVDRIFSNWRMQRRTGTTKEKLASFIDSHEKIVKIGEYWRHIESIYATFPKNQVYVAILEWLAKKPIREYRKMWGVSRS